MTEEIKIEKYPDGKIRSRKRFQNGKFHGISESWYDNQQLESQKNFNNGQFHGIFEEWYENGKLHLRNYNSNNRAFGFVECWREIGERYYSNNYWNGQRHGLCQYWTTSNELIETYYFNGDSISKEEFEEYVLIVTKELMYLLNINERGIASIITEY